MRGGALQQRSSMAAEARFQVKSNHSREQDLLGDEKEQTDQGVYRVCQRSSVIVDVCGSGGQLTSGEVRDERHWSARTRLLLCFRCGILSGNLAFLHFQIPLHALRITMDFRVKFSRLHLLVCDLKKLQF